MAKTRWGVIALFAVLACQAEPKSIDEVARRHELVYPGARLLGEQTDLLRKAHFILNPYSKEAPLMAVYDTEAPLERVVEFYVKRYKTGEPAPNESNNMRALPPPAFYTRGDLAADTRNIKPILDALHLATDITRAAGEYRGATFTTQSLPRVTLQRPYFDAIRSEVVDRTLIVMVNDER